MRTIYFVFLMLCSSLVIGQIDTSAINDIVEYHIGHNHFEGTILIAEKGQVVYQKSAGFADRKSGTHNSSLTKYGIASITKMLTAIVILQLVEANTISLDDKLDHLLPDLEIPKGNKITVHHLLLHISGLPNESNSIYLRPVSPRSFVSSSLRQGRSSKFEKFNYNNIDYVLLGLIIEKYAAEGSWEKAIRKRVIEKLNLKNTGFLKRDEKPDALAQSYQLKAEEWVADPDFYIENFFAAGSMYSTAFDLLKIDQAMYDYSLLSENSKKKMYRSYPEYNYTGYSVWTYLYPFAASNPLIMERRGGILGSNSVMVRFLESNKTIIILSNNDAFNPDSFGDQKNLREALIVKLSES